MKRLFVLLEIFFILTIYANSIYIPGFGGFETEDIADSFKSPRDIQREAQENQLRAERLRQMRLESARREQALRDLQNKNNNNEDEQTITFFVLSDITKNKKARQLITVKDGLIVSVSGKIWSDIE